MVSVAIPGHGRLRLQNLVLDYNGTLAVDGELLAGVGRRLRKLAAVLRVHVVTADTFGKVRSQLRGLDCELTILGHWRQDRAKAALVRRIGAEGTVCIGNGRNDRLMLRSAALGIAVIQAEGAAIGTLLDADIVVKSVLDAFDLLLNPLRLVAGLRI